MLPLHKISQIMNDIGINIRRIREKKGFSQDYIAEKLGINQSTYGKLERDASHFTVDRLYKLSEALQEDLATLLDVGKNTFNNQTNQNNGYGYVEVINNDHKSMIDELKAIYEKMLAIKDEEIALLKDLLRKQ
jgi:transcriptional regulator with XRE-family HTH domain